MDRHKAQIVFDMANHASTEALRTLIRICETVPDDLEYPTILLSLDLLHDHLRDVVEQFKERTEKN
jgi:hypothetical protein